MMNEIVYVKAIAQGKIASGQILVKLVAQNTDGIAPFYTSKKDIIGCEDIFAGIETPEKIPRFLQKVFHLPKWR